jgi:nicotinamidase-related amidase
MSAVEPTLHRWHVDRREYERHRTRRGRIHAYEELTASRTALVVVDMIPFFVDANPYARGIVPNIHRIAAGLRASGGVVAWLVPEPSPPSDSAIEFFGQRIASRYAGSAETVAPRERLSPLVETKTGDLISSKRHPGAFFPGSSDLHEELARRGIHTVIVTGTVANVCCESTVREAATLGYRVLMVADANAAGTDAELNATLHTVYRSFGDVRTTSDIVSMLTIDDR